MNKVGAVKWLNNLKNDIGDVRHSDLWHYVEAIDDTIYVLKECEEIVHCKECRYRSSYGECKKIKGFLGEDFAHGNVYSAICPEYEPGKDWQWLKGKKQWQ